MRSRQFDSQVNSQLEALIARAGERAKGKRSPGSSRGTRKPTGTGGQHQQAEREQDGDRFASRKSGRFRVEYAALEDPELLGEVKPPFVLLNQDNPFIAQARRDSSVGAIVCVAACLIGAQHVYSPDPYKPLLPLRGEGGGMTPKDFSKAAGSILSTELVVDGKPLIAKVAS
jgi:hypothetical protein